MKENKKRMVEKTGKLIEERRKRRWKMCMKGTKRNRRGGEEE